MDLRQMRYFLLLAQERNFSRAAERLHMAQPPLTRQIKAVEDELGTTLFVRTSRGVDLTAAGEALLQEVPNVLSLAQRAEERARLTGQGRYGRLDVGIFGSAILNVIPRMLARFHEARPEVVVKLHTMTKPEQIEALRERRIGIGFNRLVPDEPDLEVEVVLRERLVVALPESHPLAVRDTLTVRDMDDVPMILYPNVPLPGLAQQIAGAFRRDGVRLRVAQEVEDVLTAVALVSAGFGLCVTTESAASLRLPGVAYRPLASKHLHDIELACLWRRGDDSPLLQAFLEVVRGFRANR
jgi:DNA-binding transcriptional LysR family regulator